MKTNGTHLDGSDAEWLALRYVLGEMSDDEADAFERTLGSDVQACERVAAAAALATDLYTALAAEVEAEAATPDPAPRPAKPAPISAPARSVRTGLWAVVGLVAAVCLLAAGGLSLLPVISNHSDEATLERTDTGAGSLVAIWTERSAETAADAPASAETAADAPASGLAGPDRVNADDALSFTDADDAVVDLSADSVLIADDDYNVPGWMIAAVEGGGNWADSAEIREN